MNLIDAVVKAVLSEPYQEGHKGIFWWSVYVEYEDDGGVSRKKLTFTTESEARRVGVGYEFVH